MCLESRAPSFVSLFAFYKCILNTGQCVNAMRKSKANNKQKKLYKNRNME